jgi:hypothetical protein
MRVKTITCPNCGHANNFLAEECTQCGINFSRYYEELEKAETLRRHIEEQEKAEALRHELEVNERRAAEELQRTQEEQARVEEEKRLEAERLRKEQERADVLKRQQEALEEAEAIQRQKEEEEAKERCEAEARQQAEETATRRIQQEEQARLEAENRRREEEEQKRLDEAKQPETKAAQNAAADVTKPLDDVNAVEIEELETADIEEYAGAFDFIEYPADDASDADHIDNAGRLDAPPYNYRPAASIEERLRIYEGRMLGLTYGDPAEIQNIKLLAVSGDHFQVFYPISRNVVSFPYEVIISITENAEGLSAVGPDISPVFPMVVELPRPFFHAV